MTSNTTSRKYFLPAGLWIGMVACGDDGNGLGIGSTSDGPAASTSEESAPTTGAEPGSTDVNGSSGSAGEADDSTTTSASTMSTTYMTDDTSTTTDTTGMSTTTGDTSTTTSGDHESNGEPGSQCGDGVVERGEQCDDGNPQGGDGCSALCQLELCGNGVVEGDEACDDGANADSDDGCTATCDLPTCGDGFVQSSLGETCDHGEANAESGSCTPNCAVAVCGDGLVQAGVEACDDGNAVADDGCTNDCKLPSCGDGLVQAGELCDPGAQEEGTSCAVTCKAKCLYLQPGPEVGKDTRAWSRPDKVNEKIPNWVEFSAMAWTWDGVPGVHRSFVQFDFSEIPQSATVTSAILKLHGIGEHSSLSHSNASVLRRVVDSWQESGVSWNSQPQATSLHEVSLQQSVNASQNYQVSVLQLVKDAVIDPDSAFGFMLKLKDESHYAALRFASSDHPDPTKRPHLQVCYKVD